MASSWEDARRCPSDESPGEIVGRRPASRESGAAPGSQLVTLQCKNTRCAYHETPWVVQINPDNTIPDPITDREKFFPKLPGGQRARDVVDMLTRQVERETKPGGEIRG